MTTLLYNHSVAHRRSDYVYVHVCVCSFECVELTFGTNQAAGERSLSCCSRTVHFDVHAMCNERPQMSRAMKSNDVRWYRVSETLTQLRI